MDVRWIAKIPDDDVWSYSEHVHTCPEFHIVAKGECWVRLGRRPPALVKEGQLFIVPPGLAHAQQSKPDNPAIVYGMTCDVHVEEPPPEEGNGAEAAIFLSLLREKELLVADDLFDVRGRFERIFEEERVKHPGYRAGMQMLAYQIAVDSMRACMKTRIARPRAAPPDIDQMRMNQIDRIILDNLSGNLTIRDIAERVYLSERQINRTVHNARAKSLHQYILDLKCERALVYLGDPGRRVQEVAELLGFSSSQHLARYFKRKYGMIPTEYQRMHGEKRMG